MVIWFIGTTVEVLWNMMKHIDVISYHHLLEMVDQVLDRLERVV